MFKVGYIAALIWAVLGLLSFQCIGLSQSLAVFNAPSQTKLALPNCPEKCGNISIPYPFGIGDKCHYNNPLDGPYFNLTCDHSANPPRVMNDANLEVVSVTLDGEFRVLHSVSFSCFDKDSEVHFVSKIDLFKRFTISPTQNSLVAIGCDTYAWFGGTGIANTTVFNSGCMTVCNNAQKNLLVDKCSGIGCCLGFIPDSVNNISIEAKSFNKHLNVSDFNPCSVAFLVANDAMPSSLGDILTKNATHFKNMQLPVVHHWSIGTKDCETAKISGDYICKGNSLCLDLSYQRGYHCQCKPGFQGNPYLRDCQDINECAQGKLNLCTKPAYCVNDIGSYTCLCPQGYIGKGTENDTCILDPNNSQRNQYKLLIGLSVTLGSVVLFLVGWWLHLVIKRRQAIKQRAKYFERNGGLLLQQEVSNNEVVDRIRIFTINELAKATDHFNEDRVVGQGGRGTVYKGMLGEGRIVAIKKSKILEECNQAAEFINEVVILSRINHRNIVKLLGCCLETEVPLLVYEFIPNGTLYNHIHDPCEEFQITWRLRLQIASDIAGALAYLHYSSSIPIFHRDVKSSNVLLDDRYRAKLSDFGTSRILATDQTHVTTRVMGTFGYLDPEYFRSSQFTEKSDVYSFGVVLVELLTGQKAIRASLEDLEQDRSLISWFLSHMENSCLYDVIDPQVLIEGPKEEFLIIANLAKQCLDLDGKRRPTMKEVLIGIEAVLSHHIPQTCEPKRSESEQVFARTIKDHVTANSSTSYVETPSMLSSAEESLLFSPR